MSLVEEKKSLVAVKSLTARVEELIQQGRISQLNQIVSEYTEEAIQPWEKYLLAGLANFSEKNYVSVDDAMGQARSLMTPQDYLSLSSVFSMAWIRSQLMTSFSERRVYTQGQAFYQKNILALRHEDPQLAAEIEDSPWPHDYELLDFWSGPHLMHMPHHTLLLLSESLVADLAERVKAHAPISAGGVTAAQELRYCLQHPFRGLHGMSRCHYYLDENTAHLKMFLHLGDFHDEIQAHELFLFGGSHLGQRIKETLGSFRYPYPSYGIGDTSLLQKRMGDSLSQMVEEVPIAAEKEYYASFEFKERQSQIARGQLLPRIMIITSRFTTFLKYCAADFDKAFRQLGCPTRFLIEEKNTQFITGHLNWQSLHDFRPDVIFMVSHARPSVPYLPRELPFMGYIQDKCGPHAVQSDIRGHITPEDLFVCASLELQRFMLAKQVPPSQVLYLPIPVDDALFYPLSELPLGHPMLGAEVSFVKHGSAQAEVVFRKFMENNIEKAHHAEVRAILTRVFSQLFEWSCKRGDETRRYEQDMQEFVKQFVHGSTQEHRNWLEYLVSLFYLTVYSSAWRCQFIEALDQAGISVALYGNHWEEHARLKHLSRGPVERNDLLNCVYNFSKINLSINQAGTIHQRITECGLAGGFVMVADHPPDRDWGPARPFYEEGKELVFFDSRADLVDKCRYYLAHEQERRDMGYRLRERALRERTSSVGAMVILDHWRDMLRRNSP